jgi:hypothetical protein
MVVGGDVVKVMSADDFKQLRQNCITMGHGLSSFVFQYVVRNLL